MKKLVFIVIFTSLFSLAVLIPTGAASVAGTISTPSDKTCQLCGNDVAVQAVVRGDLFWMDGCPHCHEVLENVLPPLQEKYGTQLDLLLIEIVTMEDVNLLYDVSAGFGIARESTGVPLLIIGEQVLIGSHQISDELPGLIERYLAAGGVDWPKIPNLEAFSSQPTGSTLTPLPTVISTVFTEPEPGPDSGPVPRAEQRPNNGSALAVVIMVLMSIALIYSMVAFAAGKIFVLPNSVDWLIPAFIVIGMGVAGYLSYIEIQSVDAVCGPIGNCNTVQQSHYARLFGILPVGVLGVFGYSALLATWLARRYIPKLEKTAAIGFFSMTVFSVIFSLYLTYLEPFVIGAVCIWCLTSSVIVTMLLLLGLPAALRQFTQSQRDEARR